MYIVPDEDNFSSYLEHVLPIDDEELDELDEEDDDEDIEEFEEEDLNDIIEYLFDIDDSTMNFTTEFLNL